MFTRSEAVRATGKSAPTIDNYLKAGKLPNAVSIANGRSKTWQIPLTDLVAAGLLKNIETNTASAADNKQDDSELLRERVLRLEAELQVVKIDLAKAETKSEQLEARLKDSKEFFRAFQNQIETKQAQEARRFWWNRNKPILKDKPDWNSDTD
jgi:flagellar motility protein MotE (MotC chaperone)